MSFLPFPPLLNTNLTASGTVYTDDCEFWGIVIDNTDAAASTAVQVRNGVLDTSPIICQFTVAAGQNKSFALASPHVVYSGLRITITGGTVNCGVFHRKF